MTTSQPDHWLATILQRLRATVRADRIAALEQRAAILTDDRDALLAVVGDFVDAIEHRPDRLDTVAHRARIAIDGRRAWTPTR